MTKQEMIRKYNFFVRKRECYEAKIQANALLKQTVSDELRTLTANMNELGLYEDKAIIFEELYNRNYSMFNSDEAYRILDIFDSIDSHLKKIKENCQSSINYYDGEIKKIENDGN